jgi:hypothetical protein
VTDEVDRRGALIRQLRFELDRRKELKGKLSPSTKRLVELVEDAADLLEGEQLQGSGGTAEPEA